MGKIRIISNSHEPFKDRVEAGRLLAAELDDYKGRSAAVLGIPRGGMVVAFWIAKALGADLDIVLARKLGAPANPELAIGAVAEGGRVFLHDMAGRFADEAYIKKERERQLSEIARRIERYRAVRPKLPLTGKAVIISDDGLATGATMLAAIWACRQERPKRVVVAVPVAPEDTVERISQDADEVICLKTPPLFAAVGQFYKYFDQTSDEEVISLLERREKDEGED